MEELALVNDELGMSHIGRTRYSIKTKLMGMKVHLLTRSHFGVIRAGNGPSAIGLWL